MRIERPLACWSTESVAVKRSSETFAEVAKSSEEHWRHPLQRGDWVTLLPAINAVLEPAHLWRMEDIMKKTSGDVKKQGGEVGVLVEISHNKRVGLPCLIQGMLGVISGAECRGMSQDSEGQERLSKSACLARLEHG